MNRPTGEAAEASVVELAALAPVRCPCGWARRAFGDSPDSPASLHSVEILEDARTHYHKSQTETYYVLTCVAGAAVELDGERIPVKAGVAIRIPPGVRHRAVGKMTILNFVVPAFDPADEWFD